MPCPSYIHVKYSIKRKSFYVAEVNDIVVLMDRMMTRQSVLYLHDCTLKQN